MNNSAKHLDGAQSYLQNHESRPNHSDGANSGNGCTAYVDARDLAFEKSTMDEDGRILSKAASSSKCQFSNPIPSKPTGSYLDTSQLCEKPAVRTQPDVVRSDPAKIVLKSSSSPRRSGATKADAARHALFTKEASLSSDSVGMDGDTNLLEGGSQVDRGCAANKSELCANTSGRNCHLLGKDDEKYATQSISTVPIQKIKKKSKSFRIAPDGHWQARPFTDRFGSSEADVLYQFPLVQGGTNVLLPTRCVDELYVNTAYPRGVSRVRELVP